MTLKIFLRQAMTAFCSGYPWKSDNAIFPAAVKLF